MKIDMSSQFDFLPINVNKSDKEMSCKDQLETCMEACSKDQKLRQARKAQNSEGCINVPIETSGAKKKKRASRTEYYKRIKRNKRSKECVFANECVEKKNSKIKPLLLKQVKKNISLLQCTVPERGQVY